MNEHTAGEEAVAEQSDLPRLDSVEIRVLASLIEKEKTTPDYYPLTFKALTAACNQKSNRDPVMSLDDADINEALENLRYEHRLIWSVDQAGSRVQKYRHALLDKFQFTPQELAVLCELMLRGPQTLGELRTHASRLAGLESVDAVRETVASLQDWEGRTLVVQVQPGPGRREPRYAHQFGESAHEPIADAGGRAADVSPDSTPSPSRAERMRVLEEDVSSLRRELDDLRTQFTEFRKQFE